MRLQHSPAILLLGFMMAVGICACSGSPTPPAGVPQAADVTEFPVNADPAQPSRPLFVAVGPDRNIWFTEFDSKSIGVLDLGTLAITHYPLAATESNPTHLAMGPDGKLWFTETGPAEPTADSGAENLGEISSTGDINVLPLPQADSDPAGITLGPDGNIWFTEANAGDVRRSTAEGSISDPFPTSAANSMPGGIVTGPDGNLWFTEAAKCSLGQLAVGGNLSEFPLSNASNTPTEITVGADGKLWFSEDNSDRIGRSTTGGTIDEFITPTGNSVPAGTALGPDCNVWFTETNANLIGRIDQTGHITEFKIPTANSQPVGIALGPDGNLWFAESAVNKIAKLIPPAGSSTACATVTLPPVAKCQNAKVNTDAGACTAATASIDNGSFDPQDLALTKTSAPDGPYNLGTTPATLTVRQSPLVASACSAQIEVDDAEAPKLTCPAPAIAECVSPAGTPVTVAATATDNCPNPGPVKCDAPGVFPVGTTSVSCNVTDGSHNTSSCITSVTIKDSTAPVITSVSANPAMLWPPNHKMVPVTIAVSVTDSCDSSVTSRCQIVSVSSNESCSRSAPQITGPLTVMLAADRDGEHARGYKIQVQCADASGNIALGSVTVDVPHDQRDGEHMHDDDFRHGRSWHR